MYTMLAGIILLASQNTTLLQNCEAAISGFSSDAFFQPQEPYGASSSTELSEYVGVNLQKFI